jgi:hypothetical protein
MNIAVDNLYLYDPQFEAGAMSFVSDMGGSSASFAIPTAEALERALNTHVAVKFLIFDTHGEPGIMDLDDGTKFEGIDFMMVAKNGAFLKRDARVIFYGCNVGEGTPGDRFMQEVGSYLLRGKGGTVGATTVKNFTIHSKTLSTEAYMVPLSFGRLKVKRYNEVGKEIGSQTVDRHGFHR